MVKFGIRARTAAIVGAAAFATLLAAAPSASGQPAKPVPLPEPVHAPAPAAVPGPVPAAAPAGDAAVLPLTAA